MRRSWLGEIDSGLNICGREDSKCKGLEVETYLAFEELREDQYSQNIVLEELMSLGGCGVLNCILPKSCVQVLTQVPME